MSTTQQVQTPMYPVSATYHGAVAGWESTGLTYDDYQRMSTHSHVLAPGRRLATPSWAVNDTELAELLTHFMELRARIRSAQSGTLAERLARAEEKLKEQRPELSETIQRLCAEYVQVKNESEPDAERLRLLEILIPNYDTQLRMIDGGCSRIICGVVYHFYRRGLNGLQVAEELNIQHCHVRQILWRLHADWYVLKGIKAERIIERPRKFRGRPYTVDEEQIVELRVRGLSCAAISERLWVPYFEVKNVLRRIRQMEKRERETMAAVQTYTGETLRSRRKPRRFEKTKPANTRYKIYVEFCNRLGQTPLSERMWYLQDGYRTTQLNWYAPSQPSTK
jgi:hypothetical protein